jgi:hypothetical protein
MSSILEYVDIERGAVLDREKAQLYLRDAAAQFYKEAADGGEDYAEAMQDCAAMAYKIDCEGWDWILFSQCDMSASGIVIKKAVIEG